VHDHPEYGSTLTRADGTFDMAVNGGGRFTVAYRKDGYLPAQRTFRVSGQDYTWAPDVVLIEPDPKVTEIDLADNPAGV
ncbi:MAG: hypothetical protein GWO02_19585, partial [Gammaproteobacteria bacterium]|nr:hypothetical protein [Gammaproteobacteria bacterium]